MESYLRHFIFKKKKNTVLERMGKALETCVALVSQKYFSINNVAMFKSSVFSLEIRR